MKYLLNITLFASLFMISCIDEIDIPLSNDSVLVIEGLITNEPAAHKIQISRSYSFNENPVFAPIDPIVLGAAVEIIDDVNNSVQLQEGRNGSYFTPSDFAGTVGRTYTLKVTLNNGEVYHSRPETILPVGAVINEVCFENTIRQVSSAESIVEEKEVQFKINFTDRSDTRDYYRWGYEAVYEVQAPLADTSPPCDPETPPSFKCGPCNVPTKVCWATSRDTEFIKVDSDELFNGKTAENYVIYSTPADRQFNFNYAANIEQYSLTKRAYDYWNAISSQLTNNGTIFEAPNYQIKGNIYAEGDESKLVLGYFGASAKTTARVIVDGDDVPDVLFKSGPIDCSPNNSGCIPAACIDCRKWPASNIKPEYWPQ